MHLVCFSPTGNTQSVIRIAVKSFSNEILGYDLVIFGFPVCGGRVSETFRDRMNGVKGQDTLAALIATYGNLEYEDSLFEMKDIVESNGCLPVGADAVVTEHAVIRSIASGRPNANDIAFFEDFCSKLKMKIALITSRGELFNLTVSGKNHIIMYDTIT